MPTERKAVRRGGRGVDAGFENNKGKAGRGRSRGRSNAAIARCVPRDAKRYDEAEELLRQASKRIKAKLDEDDTQVAVTLHELGVCLRDGKRHDEAEKLLRQALEIVKAKLGEDDLQVAVTLQSLGVCLRDAKRYDEVEEG